MSSNLTVLVVNVLIVLCISACTITEMILGVDGWGYSYLMLLALMSSKGNDKNDTTN